MSAETKEQTPPENISVIRIILKALVLFVLINTLYIWVRPTMTASLYNTTLIPGRQRLPYSDTPETAYSLSLFNLDAMFASHEISTNKPEDEYRVLVLGDSSIWGFLLTNDQTLVSNLNQSNLNTDDHKNVRFYNLGYPTISLTKDLMLLNHAIQYQPDMIIWAITLEAFPPDKQFSPPIVQNNSQHPVHPNNFDFTLIAERRNIADVFRLQLYAPLWAATGIDQTIPETYTPHAINLKPDPTFHGSETISLEELALSKILAGHKITTEAGIPLILVNEPIFVSDGKNSDIRYNAMYPRSVYDQYREVLTDFTTQHNLIYLDAWQSVSNNEFTNTAIHLTPEGSQILANQISDFLEMQFTCLAPAPLLFCPIP